MSVFVVLFESYDSGSELLGVTTSEKLAEHLIDDKINFDKQAYPNNSSRYEQKRHRYYIFETSLIKEKD